MHRYELINYFDVWGNPKDGFVVNNSCVEFDDLMISDDATPKEIIKYLKEIGFLSTDDLRKINVDAWGDMIDVTTKNGCPICALMMIE